VKRVCTILCSVILALITVELFVSYVVGYPKFGVTHYIVGLDYRSWDKSRIYKPYSKYMVNEGKKGLVFSRNNLGFPGDDVSLSTKNNIAVLGSSFIEAQQVEPALIATSIFQQRIRLSGKNANVINLGYRGGNPLNLYRRFMYWDQRFNFQSVILVIDHYPYQNLPKDIDYVLNIPETWQIDRRLVHNAYRVARNSSSLINLFIPTISFIPQKNHSSEECELMITTRLPDFTPLRQTIDFYKNLGERLVVVSTVSLKHEEQKLFDNELTSLCVKNKIPFYVANSSQGKLRINGGGHFNEEGNRFIADALFNGMVLLDEDNP